MSEPSASDSAESLVKSEGTSRPNHPSRSSSLAKIHLHIGMPKSGSSAIQQALLGNDAALSAKGIVVPRTGLFQGAHYELVRELREERAWELWPEALSETNGFASAIISAEGLWFCEPKQVDRLSELLLGHEVQVHVYLREPSAFLCSLYRQRIKGSGRSETIDQFLAQREASVDYPQILESWAKHFSIRIRVYESLGNNVVSDFASAIGIDRLADSQGSRLNPTPNDGALRVMQWGNQRLPRSIASPFRSMVQMSQSLWRGLKPIDDSLLKAAGSVEQRGWEAQSLESLGVSKEDLAAWSKAR